MPTDDADTAETTGSVEPEVFLLQYRAIREEMDSADEAKAAVKALIQRAKASGIHVKALKQAQKIVDMGERNGKTYWDMVTLYTNWISGGMLMQEEIFPVSGALDDQLSKIQRDWIDERNAEKIGFLAGKNGEPRDNNPNQQGSQLHPIWDRAWTDGNEQYAAERDMKEIKPRDSSKGLKDRLDDGEGAQP